jgi:outer membrane protein assembly factor BamA
MRHRIAQITILTLVCLLDRSHVRAQSTPCPPQLASASDDDKPSGPRIEIVEVIFLGLLQLPGSNRDQIADLIKRQNYGNSLDGLVEDAVERVKAGWRDRGYFKVQVSGEGATLTTTPASHRIVLTFHVEEGVQYTLNEITFKNNNVISDVTALRGLFPINNGDIFSRGKIASGLNNLAKAYGDRGYMNFIAVPNTQVDDEKKLISLDIDIDEGNRFFVANVSVLGLDERARQGLLKDLPIRRGQVWTTAAASSLLKYDSDLPHCGCREELSMDSRSGTVLVTLDFRPCQTD